MTVVVQDNGRYNYAARDNALCRLLGPHLAQPGFEDRYDQDAEERAYDRAQAAFSSIAPISARANCQTILAVMIKPKPTTYKTNIRASSLFVPAGADLNSLQIKTPQNAATIVAP